MKHFARFAATILVVLATTPPLLAQTVPIPESPSAWQTLLADTVYLPGDDGQRNADRPFLAAVQEAIALQSGSALDSLAAELIALKPATAREQGSRLKGVALIGRSRPVARAWVLKAEVPRGEVGLKAWISAMLILDRFDRVRNEMIALGDYSPLADYPCKSAYRWALITLTMLDGNYEQLRHVATALDSLDGRDHLADLYLAIVKQLDFQGKHWTTATRLISLRSVSQRHASAIAEDLYLYALDDSNPTIRATCARELARFLAAGDTTTRQHLLYISELSQDPDVKRIAMNALLDADSTQVGQ